MKNVYDLPQPESGEDYQLRSIILQELQDLQLNPIKNIHVTFASNDNSLPPWSLEKLRSWEIVIKIPRTNETQEQSESLGGKFPDHLLEKLGETSKILTEFEQSKQSYWEKRVPPGSPEYDGNCKFCHSGSLFKIRLDFAKRHPFIKPQMSFAPDSDEFLTEDFCCFEKFN